MNVLSIANKVNGKDIPVLARAVITGMIVDPTVSQLWIVKRYFKEVKIINYRGLIKKLKESNDD